MASMAMPTAAHSAAAPSPPGKTPPIARTPAGNAPTASAVAHNRATPRTGRLQRRKRGEAVDDQPLARPVYGVSGLTDPERLTLARAAVDAVADRLGITDEQAVKFL